MLSLGASLSEHRSVKRSPDERSDIRVNLARGPASRFAHAGYMPSPSQMTRDPMPVALALERRDLGAAQWQLADRAARVEVTACRRVERARHLALQHDALAPRL